MQKCVESFGFRFFAAGELKFQRNREMRQIPMRKRTFFTCSVFFILKICEKIEKMGVDSRVGRRMGRRIGRRIGRRMGRGVGRHRKRCE